MKLKLSLSKKYIIRYSCLLAFLLLVLKWLKFRFLAATSTIEIYIGVIALIFTSLGIWIASSFNKPAVRPVIIKEESNTNNSTGLPCDENLSKSHGLSRRELEVLELMANGLSNQEIAAQLFVSLNTIKTHSSKLFEKLDVKRRTQAIEKGKRLKLIS